MWRDLFGIAVIIAAAAALIGLMFLSTSKWFETRKDEIRAALLSCRDQISFRYLALFGIGIVGSYAFLPHDRWWVIPTMLVGTVVASGAFVYSFSMLERTRNSHSETNEIPDLYDLLSYSALFMFFAFLTGFPFLIAHSFVALALKGPVFAGHWWQLVAIPFSFACSSTLCKRIRG